ncbi:small heat shock protein [Chaetomium fimeti]|jgi:HSP20 family molecular chaperone IbpA|uniref:Small heat shock protein n=1 Tax=Chaetomium fimeti TaxID=1854472 RepID=A0AAE0LVQ4_9PEZI|nr:small heat shock protein [Chaetomium fimeti]
MSFFTRGLYGPDPSFTPLFRLLDEFDNYSREAQGNNDGRSRHRGRQHTFQPKFDVCETDNAFELHGELPGIERDKVNIEFTDPQTLVVRGFTERAFTAGTPPAGLVEGGKQHAGVISEKGEESAAAPAQDSGSGVEEVTRHEKPKAASDKFWLQERSVGEFARTFSFPSRIDQDAVSASLNNGVLSVVVPKAKKHEARRVTIN